MIRRKLAPLFLALGLMGGTAAVAVTPQPASAAVVTTLVNGTCTVKVGFISGVTWMQTWNTGCRYIGISACDYNCAYCSYNATSLVNYNGLAAYSYIQSKPRNGQPAYYAFVSTIDKNGWTRDGVVNPLGGIIGW